MGKALYISSMMQEEIHYCTHFTMRGKLREFYFQKVIKSSRSSYFQSRYSMRRDCFIISLFLTVSFCKNSSILCILKVHYNVLQKNNRFWTELITTVSQNLTKWSRNKYLMKYEQFNEINFNWAYVNCTKDFFFIIWKSTLKSN